VILSDKTFEEDWDELEDQKDQKEEQEEPKN
jgi:hypothetical protein